VADTKHGTEAGITLHRRAGTRLCQPCVDARADGRQAWGIANGRNKRLLVPAAALQEVLAGADPVAVLAGVVGPKTLAVLRTGVVPRG
jgi:hypothetical protein